MIAFFVVIPILSLFIGGELYRFAYALPRRSFGHLLPTCRACGKRLPYRYLIPILGTILARGRCPYCEEKRGYGCLLSEIAFAIGGFLIAFRYRISFLFLAYYVVAALLILLSVIDLDSKEVPHGVLFFIMLIGLLFFILSFFPKVALTECVWWEHLVGEFVVSLPLFIIMFITGGGIGGGDVKLMFCLGFLIGYKLALVTFFFAIVLAAIVSVILLLAFKKSGGFALPLVPFLSVGFVIAIVWGNDLILALF